MQLGYPLHYGTGVANNEVRARQLLPRGCAMQGLPPDCGERTF
jgi:hypothetical protein